MKKTLLFALILVGCSKEIDPCRELLYVATTYDGSRVVEELVTNFGRVCGEELEYYKSVVGRVEPICPPDQYGRWILK